MSTPSTQPAYQFDLSGHFVGATVADESPLEEGVFLLPAACTFTPPPEVAEGHIPRWNGHTWDVVPMPPPQQLTAAQKLAAFLLANPDVQSLLG